MINELAGQLIHDLRFDAHTREHFSISNWNGKGTCGSVGCIAGTAFYRAFPELQGKFGIGDGLKFIMSVPGTAAGTGAKILGLPSESVANQLFLPWNHWQQPLVSGFADFIFDLTDNERPSLDTVEKMVAWAKSFGERNIRPGPSSCANALENVLARERMYVDWAEAWEPA